MRHRKRSFWKQSGWTWPALLYLSIGYSLFFFLEWARATLGGGDDLVVDEHPYWNALINAVLDSAFFTIAFAYPYIIVRAEKELEMFRSNENYRQPLYFLRKLASAAGLIFVCVSLVYCGVAMMPSAYLVARSVFLLVIFALMAIRHGRRVQLGGRNVAFLVLSVLTIVLAMLYTVSRDPALVKRYYILAHIPWLMVAASIVTVSFLVYEFWTAKYARKKTSGKQHESSDEMMTFLHDHQFGYIVLMTAMVPALLGTIVKSAEVFYRLSNIGATEQSYVSEIWPVIAYNIIAFLCTMILRNFVLDMVLQNKSHAVLLILSVVIFEVPRPELTASDSMT